jgi:hypothetical protein
MRNRLALIILSFAILAGCAGTPAGVGRASTLGTIVGSKSPGKWQAEQFFQVNVACVQAWVCIHPAVIHDPNTHVVTTDSESTTGLCNAGGGPIDSCNTCSASQPASQCEYWLETND